MADVPRIALNDGSSIPQLGFGVFQVRRTDAVRVIGDALEAGYRHIDTAQMYGNEADVGRAIAEFGLPRDELWVTTKCDNAHHGEDESRRALDESLDALGLDYVDLYLIHWPLPGKDRYVETWKGLEKAQKDGRTRSIGVSNFKEHHLERLRGETDTVPVVNQIELHPLLQQPEMRAVHVARGIATEAWGPLGQGRGLLEETVLADVADRHGRSPAQVVLRWHVQLGNIVFPKSATPTRIRENLAIFDFSLTAEDMSTIAELDRGRRLGPDPDQFRN